MRVELPGDYKNRHDLYDPPYVIRVEGWKDTQCGWRPVLNGRPATLDPRDPAIDWAQPGDILLWGQKSTMSSRRPSWRRYGVVRADGTLCPCSDEHARKIWQERQPEPKARPKPQPEEKKCKYQEK